MAKEKMTVSYAAWKQFLVGKKKMLAAYDQAKAQASTHAAQTHHGVVAQASFRDWLTDFLPEKYAVTPGFLVSQHLPPEDDVLKHFDIIIYDRLEAPILGIEGHPDASSGGTSRVVPVEFARAVIEVKSAMTTSSASEALGKLDELRPFLESADTPDERYKRFLPPDFFSMIVFFELRAEDAKSPTLLSKTLPEPLMRGFYGGIVLRGSGMPEAASGRISLAQSHQKLEGTVKSGEGSLLAGFALSDFKEIQEGLHLGASLDWTGIAFARYAFDVLALLNGTYELGRVSSFHGLPIAGPTMQ